jgi:hypothetical protein
MDNNNSDCLSDISDDNDIPDNISEISDIKEDNFFFSIKFKSSEYLSDTESINSSNSSNSYDTFDTSDSQILKKQDIKIKLLINDLKHTNSFKSKDEFKYIFKSMLNEEIKSKKPEININLIASTLNSELEDSSDSYLDGYKFY